MTLKNLLSIAAFLVLGLISARYAGVWWDAAVIAFFTAFVFRLPPGKGFAAMFVGGALLWGGWTVLAVMRGQSTLDSDLAALLRIGNPVLFILAISVVGGVLAGIAGWSGSSLNRFMEAKKG